MKIVLFFLLYFGAIGLYAQINVLPVKLNNDTVMTKAASTSDANEKKLELIKKMSNNALKSVEEGKEVIGGEKALQTDNRVSYEKMVDSISDMVDKRLAQKDTKLAALQFDYNSYSLMHTKRAFTWQYYSSIVIFFIVIGIVLTGLYMAYLQFLIYKKIVMSQLSRQPKDDTSADNPEKILQTDMEISDKGLKINTAVIGVIILAISLGFFFLYLKYVYPIILVNPS